MGRPVGRCLLNNYIWSGHSKSCMMGRVRARVRSREREPAFAVLCVSRCLSSRFKDSITHDSSKTSRQPHRDARLHLRGKQNLPPDCAPFFFYVFLIFLSHAPLWSLFFDLTAKYSCQSFLKVLNSAINESDNCIKFLEYVLLLDKN